MIAATYINESQFSIADVLPEKADKIRPGQRLLCIMGTDGSLITDVSATLYDADTSVLTVTVTSTALTENLSEVRRGPTFNDRANDQSNFSQHFHLSESDGGEIPLAGLSDAPTVNRLNALAAVSQFVSQFLMGVNEAGDDVTKYELKGTENEISVTFTSNSITLSLPQRQDTSATPEYAGITLSGLLGILVGNQGDPCSAIVSTAGKQVLRSNSGNTAYEFTTDQLRQKADVDLDESVLHMQALRFNAETQKWTNVSDSCAPIQPGAPIGTVLALISALV